MVTKSDKTLISEVPHSCIDMRVDKVLALLFPDYSRTTLQKWLKEGLVLVDDEVPNQRDKVQGGENIELVVPAEQKADWQPEPMDLALIYEDDDLLIVNKPAGLVVHPGAGNLNGTLVNGLLDYDNHLASLPRAGIVHRLDKGTSGVLVVARNEPARLNLIRQLAKRSVRRSYQAVVQGVPVSGGAVDEPIGRDQHDRRRMTVAATGKPAITHYRVEQRFRSHALLRCELKTGRTHQIRVHLRHIGYPLLGDPVYGGRSRIPPGANDNLRMTLQRFKRQALHAEKLVLLHPSTGREMKWVTQMPEDMAELCRLLVQDAEKMA